jgi:hypothetical protein
MPVPSTVKLNVVPAVTPGPAVLQIWNAPRELVAAFVKVRVVVDPAAAEKLALRVSRSCEESVPVLVIEVKLTPAAAASVTDTFPAGTTTLVHVPPAGARTGAMLLTVKLKFVPEVTPVPPTLQIRTVAVWALKEPIPTAATINNCGNRTFEGFLNDMVVFGLL